MNVKLKHKDFGNIVMENITEIHYCYPSPMGKRIAFESDIEGNGVTYELDDVIEFEATESTAELEAENTTMYAAILEAAEMGCVRCKVELQRIARKDAQK